MYKEREREGEIERDREREREVCLYECLPVSVGCYICIKREGERER